VAYEGEDLLYCPTASFCTGGAYAVSVSGAVWNPCGHLLLFTGGYYFHVSGPSPYEYPKYMDEKGYQRYLHENKKRELRRTYVHVPHPDRAMQRLEELLSKRWLWGVLPHNCANFVEQIVQAGGNPAGLVFNCPAREAFQ
jgi:hypothetical protein